MSSLMTSPFLPHDFNSSICDCCDDCASCVDVVCCSCCHVSAQYSMLKYQTSGVDCWFASTLLVTTTVMFGVPMCCLAAHTRNLARTQLLLFDESPVGGCCKACCCTPCSMCQVYREMSIRHWWPRGVFVDVPYQKPGLTAPRMDRMGLPRRSAGHTELPRGTREVELRSLDDFDRSRELTDEDPPTEQLPTYERGMQNNEGEVWHAIPVQPPPKVI